MPDTVLNNSSVVTSAHSISSAKRILAVTHMNPDGDAFGSLAGLGHIASALGIAVRLYCESPVPDQLAWVQLPSPIITDLDELGSWVPDRVIFLDCADAQRAGQEIINYIATSRNQAELQTLCIDHHLANPNFADINWVDPGMSATGMMVALIAKELGIPLSGSLGEAICLAIISDTGSFSYANTNALALELTAEIVRNGLSMADFTIKYENHWTLNRMHLWGALMRDVQILCDGKVIVSIVTDDILDRYNAPRSYLEDYASWLRRLADTKVVLLARPSPSGTKISLRSMGDVDVQLIAAEFGGGGHKGAAGIDMADSPVAAAEKVLQAIYRALD